MKAGGRPKGSAAPYRDALAEICERAYKELSAAGLQHEICNKEIAKAAGFKHHDYVNELRRQCEPRYRVGKPARTLKRADVDAYLSKLAGTFREYKDATKLKRLMGRWHADRQSAAKFKAISNHLSRNAK